MSGSRAAILARIARSRPQRPAPVDGDRVRPAEELVTDRATLVNRFAHEATSTGAVVHRAASHDAAMDAVLTLLGDAEASTVLAWEADDFPVAGLVEAVEQRGHRTLDTLLPSDGQARTAKLAELSQAGAGLTGAAAAIADTGTLALRSGSGRARLTWLLPPIHIVLLPAPFVYPTLANFFAARPEFVGRSSHLAFVTGPSRTADIELTLTRGVHGPKEVHIILVD